MGIGARPATCTSCSKRLTRKQWYYRNGGYFCNRRCWLTHRDKAQAAAAAVKAEVKQPDTAKAAASPKPEAEKPAAKDVQPAS